MLRGVPPSFKQSMKRTYANYQVYCALRDHSTFTTINFEEYQAEYSHISIIPTMNAQTVKKDEDGQPVQAKSRIVVLGNLEDTIWTNSEVHDPVIEVYTRRAIHRESSWLGR
jgi:hypothetical protein